MDVRQLSREGMSYYSRWLTRSGVFEAVRKCFDFDSDRFSSSELLPDWPEPLGLLGPLLLSDLSVSFGSQFTSVSFQAYRNGSGCRWHTDAALGTQAILSLGTRRMFGVRPNGHDYPTWYSVGEGDLVFMTSAWQEGHQHRVPEEEHIRGERIALVFRTLDN